MDLFLLWLKYRRSRRLRPPGNLRFLDRLDADNVPLLFVARVPGKLDDSWLGSKNSVIPAHGGVVSGSELGASLPHHDGTRLGVLPRRELEPQSSSRRITSVAGRSSLFLGGHASHGLSQQG